MPHISVVIPTYDRKEFLEQAIETVRLQTHEPLECVVVDDGSTDGTREYLGSLEYEGLRTVYFDENRGQSVARNAGIEAAKGEYVLFLDSDDVLYPHAAEVLLDAVESHAGTVGAFGSAKLVNSRNRVKKRTIPSGRMEDATLENANSVGGLSATLFKCDTLQNVGGFDESLPRRVDVDLYLKLLNRGVLYGVDRFLCERRIHDEGLSDDDEKVKESYRRIAKKHSLDTTKYSREGNSVYDE